MATVRKRTHPSGEVCWQAGYVDGSGTRRFKAFAKKSEAEAWLVDIRHDVARGVHTPASASPTVKEAGALWIKRCNEKQLEPSTVRSYEEHCHLHIFPYLGTKRLSDLNAPAVNAFADKLREEGRSPEMIRRVVRSLGAIFREARRRGMSSTDPTAGIDLHLPDRDDPRPVAPTKAELQAIIAAAPDRWRPLILVAIFCGLRASELRGLSWAGVDFEGRQIKVMQRADIFHRIGKLKSKSTYREIPCPSIVLNALREWKLRCPKGDLGLVFPSGNGNVEALSNITQRGFEPLQVAAGVIAADGTAKYGMHALRHACASLWIEQGMNPKRIQKLMGHSSIQMTFDRYGHWFTDGEADQRAAEDIQLRLLGE
jgi:integrase